MYKVVVVEDDRIIRKAIVKSDWHSVNANVVGEASNGEDALAIIEETRPHLVITDINMPFMNGITLAKRVREAFEDTRIIFLTGYDDFEYLHEAILLKSDDYLLKPIKMNDLLDKAEKALAVWVKENNRSDQLSETLPMLQEQFISKMLFNKEFLSDDALVRELDRLSVKMINRPFLILNILAVDYSNDRSLYEVLRVMSEKNSIELLYYQMNEVFMLYFLNEKDELLHEKQAIREEILTECASKGIDEIIVTESDQHTQISEFKMALLEAKVNMEQELTHYNNEELEDSLKLSLEKQLIEIERIDAFLHLLELNTFKLNEVKKIGFNIATYISEILNHINSNENEEEHNVYETGQRIMRADNHQELYAIIQPLLQEWKKEYERLENDSLSDSLIKRAKTYIDENYGDPELTLTSLADEIHITAPYLSNLFKSELKMNFTGYLLELRMDKAKNLLAKTDLKTYQVANRVGYSNSHYFSSSFKKYTGQTPTSFKKSIGKK